MKKALVTGANRGLGLEFVRQLKQKGFYVIATHRSEGAQILSEHADEIIKLDVRSDSDIQNLQLALQGKPIDLLVNNAGISGQQGVTVGNIHRDNFMDVFNVNCVGVIKLCDALLEQIKASEDKSILVVSSSMGSIAENKRGRSYAYRASKAALNCVMRSFAIDVAPQGVRVMLLHPGWVKTRMGGDKALLDTETSVRGMLEQAEQLLPQSHAQALRCYDGGVIPW